MARSKSKHKRMQHKARVKAKIRAEKRRKAIKEAKAKSGTAAK